MNPPVKIARFAVLVWALLGGELGGWPAAWGGPPDPRNFANGAPIPCEGYCDQPRVVVTRDGTWVCVLTTGPGQEGAAGQHVVATSSVDFGQTWTPAVDVEPADPEKKSSYALA